MAMVKLNVGGTWENTLYTTSKACTCSSGCNTTCKSQCNTGCGGVCGGSCNGYCNCGCEGKVGDSNPYKNCGTTCKSICLMTCNNTNEKGSYNGSETTYYRKIKVNTNGSWKISKTIKLNVGSTWKSVP